MLIMLGLNSRYITLLGLGTCATAGRLSVCDTLPAVHEVHKDLSAYGAFNKLSSSYR